MLRSSKSAVNPPVFTCAFCTFHPARRFPIRQLHSSDKANENELTPRPRTEPAYVAPSGFQSFRKKPPVEEAASKWNIPESILGGGGGGGGGGAGRGSNITWGNRNSTNNSPPLPFRTGRANADGGYRTGGSTDYSRGRQNEWSKSPITRPEDVRRPAGNESLQTGTSRYAQRSDSFPMPSFGRNDRRMDRDMPMPNFGRDDRGTGGDGPGQLPYFGRDTKSTGGARQGFLPRFGKDEQRLGGTRQGRPERTTRGFPQESERYGRASQSEQQYGQRTRDDAEAPSELRTTSEADLPIQTRVKVHDETFSRRQAAKLKDRGRNRRFDDEESAILGEDVMSAKEAKKAKKAAKRQARKELIPIFLPQFISVENLASVLGVRVEKFATQLKEMGFTETSNDHVLGAEEAGLIAGEYGYEPVIDKGHEIDLKQMPIPEDKSVLPARPPVVTIMGHVDHGKTTLLDWLRKSSIVASEHGGITQHIGAFSVTMPTGKVITFLDTPGHAAFLSMRERGANVTDIVILVVAADDSVKPQTIEAIKHAKAANVPIIVAINKIDKADSNVEKVQGDLARYGVDVEDLGGDTQTVCVSGKTGQGMEDLEESVIALSEILDHRAEPEGQVEGWVLEATTKKKGRVATVLVTRGTLKPGDIVVAGNTWTKVKTMTNEYGDEVSSAPPGTPVEIDGWRDQPDAGDLAISAPTEDRAKQVVEYRVEKSERIKQATDMEAINESRRAAREKEELEDEIRRAAQARGEDPDQAVADAAKKANDSQQAKIKEVKLIVKADVSGSVEAIVDSVSTLGNHEVKTKVLRSSFGAVSEFDIDHAAASGAYILAFNLPSDPQIYQYARAKNVTILAHNVIYHLVDNVRDKLSDLLPPKITITITGEAEILQVFQINLKGRNYKPVAGCRVKTGVVERNKKVRVFRNKEVVFDGNLDSLKNVKKDVLVMKKDTDCGMGFDGWRDFKEGDLIQCYEVIEEKRTL